MRLRRGRHVGGEAGEPGGRALPPVGQRRAPPALVGDQGRGRRAGVDAHHRPAVDDRDHGGVAQEIRHDPGARRQHLGQGRLGHQQVDHVGDAVEDPARGPGHEHEPVDLGVVEQVVDDRLHRDPRAVPPALAVAEGLDDLGAGPALPRRRPQLGQAVQQLGDVVGVDPLQRLAPDAGARVGVHHPVGRAADPAGREVGADEGHDGVGGAVEGAQQPGGDIGRDAVRVVVARGEIRGGRLVRQGRHDPSPSRIHLPLAASDRVRPATTG